MAVATAWASRIMTVSLEMVLPGLLGVWLDARLGTQVLFALVGFAGGSVLAVWHLIRMTKPAGRDSENESSKEPK